MNDTLEVYGKEYRSVKGFVAKDILKSDNTYIRISGVKVITSPGITDVESYSIASVPAGEAFTPATTITTNPDITFNSSTGLVTASYTGHSYIAPSITPGYVSQGTSGVVSVTGNKLFQLPSKAATTYIPTTSDQFISAGQYLTGSQTIKGDANLVSSNIASGVGIFGVEGTHVGGIIPTGTHKVYFNGIYDVTNYMSVDVNTEDIIIAVDAMAEGSISTALVGNASYISSNAFIFHKSLVTASFSLCKDIGINAFSGCSKLETVYFPICTNIARSAFYMCSSLTTASFPACTSIGTSAFAYCSALTTASFPNCTSIGTSAFRDCTALTTASFPNCTSIGTSAFRSCTALTTISFPNCTSIGNYAFRYCLALITISFPNCISIGTYAFANCSELTTVSFSACTSINGSAFYSCSALITASFPSCTNIGSSAFASCYSLTTVSFPNCKSIGSYAFAWCSKLTTASFPSCTSISGYAFASCYNLLSLYLLGSSVCSIVNVNAFMSTPISNYTASTGGVYGSIYVPASLLTEYKNATNWTTYSDRIVGI